MIPKSRIVKFLIISLALFFIFHIIATNFFLYWRILWLDNVMHFLGGAWLASFAVWFFCFSEKVSILKPPRFFVFIFALGFAALAGILWEFHEFLLDQFIVKKGYLELSQAGVKDTMSDLFFDLFGAAAAALIFLRKKIQ